MILVTGAMIVLICLPHTNSSGAKSIGWPFQFAYGLSVISPFAVILDAISYVASAFLILGIKRQEPRVKTGTLGEKGPGMRAEIAEGLRYILSNPMLSKIAACTGSSNLFSNISFAVLPLYHLVQFRPLPMSRGSNFSPSNKAVAILDEMTMFGTAKFGAGALLAGACA